MRQLFATEDEYVEFAGEIAALFNEYDITDMCCPPGDTFSALQLGFYTAQEMQLEEDGCCGDDDCCEDKDEECGEDDCCRENPETDCIELPDGVEIQEPIFVDMGDEDGETQYKSIGLTIFGYGVDVEDADLIKSILSFHA